MLVFCTACSIAATRAGAAEVNLLQNPAFDQDVSGWTEEFRATAEWSLMDVAGALDSGSALVRNVSDAASLQGIRQCVEVVPGGSYDFGASSFVPVGQDAFSAIQVRVEWLSEPDCTSGYIDLFSGMDSISGAWVTRDFFDEVAPLGTRSALIRLAILKTDAREVRAFFDGAFFVPEPTPTVLRAAALLALAVLVPATRGARA